MDLKSRLVYVKTDAHIEALFLTCFISLLILRILEMKTKRQFSSESIIESLNKANVVFFGMDLYKAVYYDEILAEIDKCIGTNLRRKNLHLSDIKKIVSETK